MTRTRSITPLLAALGLSAALVGCGQSEAPTGSAPTTEDVQESTTPPSDEDDTASPSDEDEDDSAMTGDKPEQTRIPVPGEGSGATGGLPLGEVSDRVVSREDVQAAMTAEAERSGISAEAVTVAGYADVTWSDGSIGCPKDGMMYTQALVPGHQLILEVDGEYRSYHAAEGKPFSYCAQPSPPTSAGSVGGTSDS